MIPMQYALRRRMISGGGGGAPLSDLPVGSLIRCDDGGSGIANYEIAGFNVFQSGDTCLVRKDVYALSAMCGGGYVYSGSVIDNYLQNTVRSNLDAKLQALLISVPFATWGNTTSSITRNIFTPTNTMLGLTHQAGAVEGPKLSLYTSNTSRIKKRNGAACRWWTGSRYGGSQWYFIETNGTLSSAWNDTGTIGFAPAFVIPNSTMYNPAPNPDGSYNLVL